MPSNLPKTLLGLALAAGLAGPASAALPVGAKAPPLVTDGAFAGKPFHLNLAAELKKGPVVLYFYPKAFTKGCMLEARAFSKAIGDFQAAGAQVFGLSADDLPTLKRFSVEDCGSAFPVAIATRKTIRDYGVSMPVVGAVKTMSNRTSYVIDRRGRIVMVHSDMEWSEHVAKSLAAVRSLKR
jgi:thioredoxin-dependent peroxiredoxin